MFFNSTDSQSQLDDAEHKTHVSALVFLVMITLVVVAVSLSIANPEPKDNNSFDTQITNEAIQPVQVERVNGMEGIPANPPMVTDATMLQNIRNDLTGGQTQRIIAYSIAESVDSSELTETLRSWALENEFSIQQTSRTNGSGILLAGKSSGQLFVSWAQSADTTRVEINHVNI